MALQPRYLFFLIVGTTVLMASGVQNKNDTTRQGSIRKAGATQHRALMTCGNGSRGDGVCADGTCCSQYGWCGTSDEHCTGGGPGPPLGTSSCEEGWTEASLTTYTSYPPCCNDPHADQTECTDFSGCAYQGEFAFIPNQSEEWVKTNDVCAFFSTHGDIDAYKNRKILIAKWDMVIECNVVDTCADSDCDGCCTENAGEAGYLIDMEYWTVNRYYGDGNAFGKACFKVV